LRSAIITKRCSASSACLRVSPHSSQRLGLNLPANELSAGIGSYSMSVPHSRHVVVSVVITSAGKEVVVIVGEFGGGRVASDPGRVVVQRRLLHVVAIGSLGRDRGSQSVAQGFVAHF